MAWSQSDIDTLQAAILRLASGEAVLTVSYSGPPARTVTHHAVDLKAMRELLATMQADVNAAAGGKPYRFAATRKGF